MYGNIGERGGEKGKGGGRNSVSFSVNQANQKKKGGLPRSSQAILHQRGRRVKSGGEKKRMRGSRYAVGGGRGRGRKGRRVAATVEWFGPWPDKREDLGEKFCKERGERKKKGKGKIRADDDSVNSLRRRRMRKEKRGRVISSTSDNGEGGEG